MAMLIFCLKGLPSSCVSQVLHRFGSGYNVNGCEFEVDVVQGLGQRSVKRIVKDTRSLRCAWNSSFNGKLEANMVQTNLETGERWMIAVEETQTEQKGATDQANSLFSLSEHSPTFPLLVPPETQWNMSH